MSWTFSHAEEYGWVNDDFYSKEEAIKGLNDAGLPYTEDEVERLIQSAVAQFNGVFKEGNRHEK